MNLDGKRRDHLLERPVEMLLSCRHFGATTLPRIQMQILDQPVKTLAVPAVEDLKSLLMTPVLVKLLASLQPTASMIRTTFGILHETSSVTK